MGWIYLFLAGVFEIGFTTAMRFMSWPPRHWPVVAFLVTAGLSFGLLIAAIQTLPLGTAYAVWTGMGAAGTAILGIAYFGEPGTTLRLVFLTLLIGSLIGLKAVSPH